MKTNYLNESINNVDDNFHLDFSELKILVKEVNDAIAKGVYLDKIPKLRFCPENKGKCNPYGYDIVKNPNIEIPKIFYRRNRMLNKLIRVQREFHFVESNIEYYRELTFREKEIIQLLARGNNNPKIAEKLFISRCTVEQHRKNINHKLKIKSFPHLMKYAYSFDLI